MSRVDLVVVGGGLAGLTCATLAARRGLRVAVLERARTTGGMARSAEAHGVRLNMGPRALYPPAERILVELGIPFSGGKPPLNGRALRDGTLHPMPDGILGLLASPLFAEPSARAASAALGDLVGTGREAPARVPLAAWVEARRLDEHARQLVLAIVRAASYIDAPGLISTSAAASQLEDSAEGVRYVDGGWQALADGLGRAATDAGAAIRTAVRVTRVRAGRSGVVGVALAGGETLDAPAVVLAVDPAEARTLLADTGASIAATTPVRAAVLDVAMRSLPSPEAGYLIALDRPLYFSVHSLVARFDAEGGTVVHVARYLRPDERPAARAVRGEFEWLLDGMQPGWRDGVEYQRFLPEMTVTHALPAAATGGLAGRPAVGVDGVPGAFLAGDWVGDQHQLAAAALASAKRAAALALRRVGGANEAPKAP